MLQFCLLGKVILTSRANWFHTLIFGLSSFVLPDEKIFSHSFHEDYAAARQFDKCASRYAAPFIALAGGEARSDKSFISPLLEREQLSENRFDRGSTHLVGWWEPVV